MKIGFISDIHEDIRSLEKALDIVAEEMCEAVICLGDIAGFALPFYRHIPERDVDSCVEHIKKSCKTAVAGNHDLYAVRRVPIYAAGFDYGDNWYDLDYETKAGRAQNKIWLYEDGELPAFMTKETKEYLRSLNELEQREFDGFKFLFTHFCFPDFSGSTIHFPSEAIHLRKHLEFMRTNNCMIGVSGHGHPEGCVVVTGDEYKFCSFGTHELRKEPQWIVAPCVARTSRSNGVLIIDLKLMQIKVIPIHSIKPFI